MLNDCGVTFVGVTAQPRFDLPAKAHILVLPLIGELVMHLSEMPVSDIPLGEVVRHMQDERIGSALKFPWRYETCRVRQMAERLY